MSINQDVTREKVGTLTRGNITLVGIITEVTEDDFVFVTEGIEVHLEVDDWDFTPAPGPAPKPGWYSHNEYPVREGYSPLWIDGSGGSWTFSLKKQDGGGKTEPLLFKMEVPWDQLTALEQPDAAAPQE